MAKTRKRARAAKRSRKPVWITDEKNQEKWNGRFIRILEQDDIDPIISTLLSNKWLSQLCATRIRSYVDKAFTDWWYGESKARGIKHKQQLETAIGGLRVASVLCSNKGNQKLASRLGALAAEFLLELAQCKHAFATKRHGRDRDHSLLLECRAFLQRELGRPVGYPIHADEMQCAITAVTRQQHKHLGEKVCEFQCSPFSRSHCEVRMMNCSESCDIAVYAIVVGRVGKHRLGSATLHESGIICIASSVTTADPVMI